MFQRLGLDKKTNKGQSGSSRGVVKIIRVDKGKKKKKSKRIVVPRNTATTTTTATATIPTTPPREWLNKDSFKEVNTDEYQPRSVVSPDGDGGEVVRVLMPCSKNYSEVYPLHSTAATAELESCIYWIGRLFSKPSDGIESMDSAKDTALRRVKRGIKHNDYDMVKEAVEYVNSFITSTDIKGVIQYVQFFYPVEFIHFLLGVVYERVVSPNVDQLVQYQAFSNNVYGELLPPFMTMVGNQVGLNSDCVFIDLGSGVGQCVLQTALEFECCACVGVEIMDSASKLANMQLKEFLARTAMWGINHSKDIALIGGDFLSPSSGLNIPDLVAKYPGKNLVLLCNNYVFSPQLNNSLVDMFLDLPEGAKIISLKSFVPPLHSISNHNIESPINLLAVEEFEYFSKCVSWSDSGGKYYISTIDRTRIASHQSSSSPGGGSGLNSR